MTTILESRNLKQSISNRGLFGNKKKLNTGTLIEYEVA